LRGVTRNTPRNTSPQSEMSRNSHITKVLQSLIDTIKRNPMMMAMPSEQNIIIHEFFISVTRCCPVSVNRADDTFS
jgi:hypothetical protein